MSGIQKRILILYGSQTGNAQDLAESIWRETKKFNCSGPVLPMNSYNTENLINENYVIFVCSTTGQGDQPDNMKIFWKFLLKKSLPLNLLENMKFTVLGLGDSSYQQYNFVAKKLHKRLLQLSAEPLLSVGLCDDQHDYGIYGTFYKWIEELWNVLDFKNKNLIDANYYYKMGINVVSSNEIVDCDLNKLKWPYLESKVELELTENLRVTNSNHFQDVRHMKFKIPNAIYWKPFDTISLYPSNSDDNVDKLFDILEPLNIRSDTLIEFASINSEMPLPMCFNGQILSLKLIAKYVWDLQSIPRHRVFEVLALNCINEVEKEKLLEFCSADGCDDLIKYVNRPRRTIIEVLYDFPHATQKLTLESLFEIFDFIQQRSFSIASIPETETLDILVAIVEYKTILSEPRKGLCSNWLKNLSPSDVIFGSIKAGTMKLTSQQEEKPLIIIGPGTGIAPFRSLLLKKELELANKRNTQPKILVFFGCRSKFKDFYFKEDFLRLQSKHIALFFFAFSRDQENKRYVQHLIKEQEFLVTDYLIIKQGSVLVVGNSKNMPQQVKETFKEILGNSKYFDEIIIKNKRYQEEVWS